MARRPKREQRKGEQDGPTFEQALERLEEVAQSLENGELGLEEAIALAEEGLKLSDFCEKQLTQAEGKVQQLVKRMGAAELAPATMDETEENDEE